MKIQSNLNVQPPLISDHHSKTPNVTQSKHFFWNLSQTAIITCKRPRPLVRVDGFIIFFWFLTSRKRLLDAWTDLFVRCVLCHSVYMKNF